MPFVYVEVVLSPENVEMWHSLLHLTDNLLNAARSQMQSLKEELRNPSMSDWNRGF